MNLTTSTNRKFKRMFVNILSIVVILAMAFPVTTVTAASDSPFVGKWEAVDVDGSDIRLAIGGPPSGPFQITWTESKDDGGLGFCEGGPGIVRGTGLLNENDPLALEADLWVECFTIEKSMEFHLTFRYIPSTDALTTTYSGGMKVVFTHPTRPQASPAQVRLMTNYQEDWTSGFYEAGHTVWLAVTESDGISVKATAEMITGPQPGWDGGEIGFASQPWEWQPEQPDIVPGDWVYAWVDNGASAQMQVGEISAWVDLEKDQVLGTVSASWYRQEVYIYCFLWGGTDARDDMIMADGSEEFICSWSGGAYDIQPGDVAEVQYYGPDGHAVDYYLFIPNPRFVVFPEWEWFDGNDWPDGATVNITVEGKPECTISKESWNFFFNGSFGEGCDVVVGDTITFTDGTTTRTHVVRNLAITDVDKDANTVAGTADDGATVYAWVHEYGYDMELQTADGIWLADFGSAGLDLVENMGGRAEIRDEFGNSTAVDWWIPTPHFSVFPEWEYIEGWDWPDGATVSATIDEKPICSAEGTSVHPEWDPNALFVPLWFPEGCDVLVGDVVTLTDGTTWRTHTVQNLAVTAVDADANIVAGTADPGAEVHVWPHGYNELLPTTGEDSTWLAEFDSIGIDLVQGMGGRTEIRDETGNATAVEWRIPNTRFTVWPEQNYLEGYEWPDGALVSISVAGKDACLSEAVSSFPEWDPSNTFFSVNFPEGCDVGVRDSITLSHDALSLTHEVQELAITEVNVDADMVAGTAAFDPEQYYLHTWIHGVDGSYMPLSAEGGAWSADFSFLTGGLQPGMGGRVELVDQASNATAVEWYIPNPRFVVFPEWEWFDGNDWPDGTTVDITVEGKPECTTSKESWGFFFNGSFDELGEGCDVVSGDTVTFTAGETIRTHTVRNLAITNVDQVSEAVSGTSDPNETVYVWQHEPGPQIPFKANEYGEWFADLNGYYDVRPGSGGRSEIRDEFGNSTAVDWYIPIPRIVVQITDDWFRAENFTPNGQLTFWIYDGQGGSLLRHPENTWQLDGSGWVTVGMWELDEYLDLVPGNFLVVSDGTMTKELMLEAFTFDVFDATIGHLQGTAPEPFGRTVWVGIGLENDAWTMDVTTDPSGNWSADFGAPVPSDYQWVAAQIFDEDGDASELRPTSQAIFLRPACGDTYTVQAGGFLEIRYGSWVAIGKDLAIQNAEHLTVELVLNGETVAGNQQSVVPRSEIPCGIPLENAFGVYYVASVDPLSPGTYVAEVTWIFDEPVTDGYDADGDGLPDWYEGEIAREFTLIVP